MKTTHSSATELVLANIWALMGIQKKTVTDLATELQVVRQTAGIYTYGNQAMTSDQLATTAHWLGVEVGDLFR